MVQRTVHCALSRFRCPLPRPIQRRMGGSFVRIPGSGRFIARLQAGSGDTLREDEVSQRALMVLSGAYLCLAGALLTIVWLALPYSPPTSHEGGLILMAVAASAMAALMLAAGDRMPAWGFHGFAAGGMLMVTGTIYYSEPATSPYAFLYLWVALYALYFFTPTKAALHILSIAVAYAAVLAADLATGHKEGGLLTAMGEAAPRWTFTVGTLVVAVVFVRLLKDRLDRLVARLADAVREDPLTRLRNRRGFDETFELEIERARRRGGMVSLVLGDLDHFKDVNDRFGHPRGDEVLRRTAEILQATNRRIDLSARVGGEEFAVLLPDSDERGAHIAAERMRRAVGEAFADDPLPLTISFGVASFPAHGETTEDLMESADRALYTAKEIGRDCSVIFSPDAAASVTGHARRRRERGAARLTSLLTLAESLDSHAHARTVGTYAREIGRQLGFDAEHLEKLMLAGMLHDVGKVGIQSAIVNKPAPLTPEEWKEMRKHAEIGATMLDGMDMPEVADWIRKHHERPDGLGYPLGIAGDDIPVEARIVSVADAYEAMTHDRVYRPALGAAAARRELEQGVGTQFDGTVVEAFLRVLPTDGVLAAGRSILARG
jgi:diguanylate cyclase (GGDEF)-like protein/putative nucleotidyltransferase with HDIG domain